jgi:uncharacterized protein YqeY
MLENKLEQDLKAALLAKDSQRVSVLRGLKSVLLNVKVAEGKRESGLGDDEILKIFAKEAKKRQESADLYKQGGDEGRAGAELAEKAIIEEYLPEQMSEEELSKLVDEAVAATGAKEQKDMGKVIGMVRGKAGAGADGAAIARLVKAKLQEKLGQ